VPAALRADGGRLRASRGRGATRAAAGTRLEVVIEPTGPAWLPVAVFFTGRGHSVYRVSSAKASDLRKFFSRHAKSNGIDADTLARLPLVAPAGLQPLELPGPEAAALDRRVRAADRLTRVAAEHKVRIKDLVHQLMPLTPLTGDLGAADLAVLERYADPRALLKAGPARLSTLIDKASHGHHGAERATAWRASATAAVELYAAYPAMPFSDLADEVVSEVRLLRATQTEIARHGEAREQAYRPVLVAVMGRAARFPTAGHFRSYTGLTPRASETGNTDRKGQPMSKAGSSLLRTTLAAPPTPPANRTPNSRRSTTRRWSTAAPTTSKRSAWSPPPSPNAPGRCCAAACPTSSATPTPPPSPPSRPKRSSPSSGRSPPRSAPADAAPKPPTRPTTRRRGRPLNKSSQDKSGQTREAPTNEATPRERSSSRPRRNVKPTTS